MLNLKGKLTISHVSGRDVDEVCISLADDDARATAVEIHVDLETFCKCLFAHAYQDCTFEWNDSGRVGTVGENKEELVPVPSYDHREPGWQARALKPFEVDGWQARSGDIDNMTHRHFRKDGKDYMSVVFFRNVPKAGGKSAS